MKTPVTNIFNRTNINDNQINKPILKRNIKFLAESLLAFLFDYDIKVNFILYRTLLSSRKMKTYWMNLI